MERPGVGEQRIENISLFVFPHAGTLHSRRLLGGYCKQEGELTVSVWDDMAGHHVGFVFKLWGQRIVGRVSQEDGSQEFCSVNADGLVVCAKFHRAFGQKIKKIHDNAFPHDRDPSLLNNPLFKSIKQSSHYSDFHKDSWMHSEWTEGQKKLAGCCAGCTVAEWGGMFSPATYMIRNKVQCKDGLVCVGRGAGQTGICVGQSGWRNGFLRRGFNAVAGVTRKAADAPLETKIKVGGAAALGGVALYATGGAAVLGAGRRKPLAQRQ